MSTPRRRFGPAKVGCGILAALCLGCLGWGSLPTPLIVSMPALMGRTEDALPAARVRHEYAGGYSLFEFDPGAEREVVKRRYDGPAGKGIAPYTLEAVMSPTQDPGGRRIVALSARFDYSDLSLSRLPSGNAGCLRSMGFTGPCQVLCASSDRRHAVNRCTVDGRQYVVVTYFGDFGRWIVCLGSVGDLRTVRALRGEGTRYWPELDRVIEQGDPVPTDYWPGLDPQRLRDRRNGIGAEPYAERPSPRDGQDRSWRAHRRPRAAPYSYASSSAMAICTPSWSGPSGLTASTRM